MVHWGAGGTCFGSLRRCCLLIDCHGVRFPKQGYVSRNRWPQTSPGYWVVPSKAATWNDWGERLDQERFEPQESWACAQCERHGWLEPNGRDSAPEGMCCCSQEGRPCLLSVQAAQGSAVLSSQPTSAPYSWWPWASPCPSLSWFPFLWNWDASPGGKKVKRSHGKTCGTQHRVGAWKVTVSFLADASCSLALHLPAKAVVQEVGQGRTVSQEGTWCEGGWGGPRDDPGAGAWEAEPSSALPIQPSPCLRTVPCSFHPRVLAGPLGCMLTYRSWFPCPHPCQQILGIEGWENEEEWGELMLDLQGRPTAGVGVGGRGHKGTFWSDENVHLMVIIQMCTFVKFLSLTLAHAVSIIMTAH